MQHYCDEGCNALHAIKQLARQYPEHRQGPGLSKECLLSAKADSRPHSSWSRGAKKLEAEAWEQESVDLYSFTSVLCRELDQEGRQRIVEMLWDIVLADGVLHEYEADLVSRGAELLGVSTRDRVRLRKIVESRTFETTSSVNSSGLEQFPRETLHVCYGSLADLSARMWSVRFTPKSGHDQSRHNVR